MNNHLPEYRLPRKARQRGICLAWVAGLILCASPAWGSEIRVALSGDGEYPGVLSLKKETREIKRLCFVGIHGKGRIDRGFIRKLEQAGIPEGTFRVTGPMPEENWPAGIFLKNGALRMKPVSEAAGSNLRKMGLQGLAIHGRDFYPVAQRLVQKKQMIGFYSRQLFKRLKTYWGALGITNWDMDRLYDFWRHNTQSPDEWRVTVVAVANKQIRKLCQPPEVKRKPD
ncbi:MAG: hypothetical protein GWM98_13805 [Nitrospinaceae bacterium]|nr:hypothetical protein [Nitrospinaceae bacterium]NIR55351.1 hypothetical protein [Nitrospinaceae bacterium]NIS85790.1 hypothetical protein [Nitrospinaceae bacterium]NIT82640.1 hypothetical protein [Nitrospinaceae bacterium]NIU44845.1 hypothetical protein [Nitrospinaceae bacterium]